MTASSSVIRWPEPGQFWVWRNPLSLLRVEHLNGDVESGMLECTRWTPRGKEQFITLNFDPTRVEYLWSWCFIPQDKNGRHLKPGDALMHDGRLIFVAPPMPEVAEVLLVASWQVGPVRHLVHSMSVYQPGPSEDPAGKTAYEHLLEEGL